jgi:hypothetical protein
MGGADMIGKSSVALRAGGLVLLMGAGGCAYGLSRTAEIINPERLARVRSVTVAPFRYPHRWTGLFRGIYRSAEIDPPAEEKVERIEATFLPEGVLVGRGYEVLKWPAAAGEMIWREEAPEVGDRAALLKALTSGAEAVLMIRGRSECREIHHCMAEVEMMLIDTEEGSVLWKSRAEGETLVGQGNEMLAAVEEALADLPGPP